MRGCSLTPWRLPLRLLQLVLLRLQVAGHPVRSTQRCPQAACFGLRHKACGDSPGGEVLGRRQSRKT